MASTYLYRTPGSAGNRKTWTWSGWIKRSSISVVQQTFAVGSNAATPWFLNYINSDDTLHIWFHDGTSSYFSTTSNQLRDPSAWYHIVYAVDTTQATASDRFKVYINGTEASWSSYNPPAQNFDTQVNTTSTHYIGAAGNGQYFDGYMAHVNFTDGTAYNASSFGETDTNGQWKPITAPSVTYGTNGFFLKFANSGSLGADSSGNGNNFTQSGSGDQVTDTPDNVFATLNPTTYDSSGMTFSEGNSKVIGKAGASSTAVSTQSFSSGKWYAEFKIGNTHKTRLGVKGTNWYDNNNTQIGTVYDNSGYVYIGTQESGSLDSTIPSYTTGDIIGIFVDKDNNTLKFSKNGTVHGVSQTLSQNEYAFYIFDFSGTGDEQLSVQANFGNPSFSISSGNSDVNGYGNFEYSPNDGTYDYLALCTKNLASELTLPIGKGSDYMNTVLYTGNHPTGQSITGVGFQPDWVWAKCRSAAQASRLFDSTRGALNNIISSATNAEQTLAGSLTSFDSDGFTLGSDDSINYNGRTFVAWNWKANGGTTSSNTDGATTSTVQADTTAGFSVVTYDMGGSNSTFGHGLGKTPACIFFKRRDAIGAWVVYHQSIGVNGILTLNATDAAATGFNYFPNMTSTIVGVAGSSNMNNDTVAYCFAEIEGYSKFGSYTGNGSDDGTFIYTGFRPSFVMMKKTSSTGNWCIFDDKRDIDNVGHHLLFANLSNAEETTTSNRDIDFVSNGFKQREGANQDTNGSGGTYIYMAFAENPFVDSTGRPVTAR